MGSVEERVAIEQASKWLEAWAVDQGAIADKQPANSPRAERFKARSEALHDAARDLLTSDIWDTSGFLRADGFYERVEAKQDAP